MGALRLFLAVSVVIGHTAPLFGLDLLPAYEAVRTFFMISGFYMALVLAEKYRDRPGLFYSNRALRLYPTYFIALAITVAVSLAARSANPAEARPLVEEIVRQLHGQGRLDGASLATLVGINLGLFGSDATFLFHHTAEGWRLTMGFPDLAGAPTSGKASDYLVISPVWSLGAEVLFYALAPWIARLRTRWLATMAAAGLAVHFGAEALRSWSSYFLFPANLGFFLLGMLGHRAMGTAAFASLNRRFGKLVTVGALGLLVGREFIPFFRNYQWLHFPVAAVAIPFIFQQTKALRWDRFIGELSYPVYIYHAAGMMFVGCYLGRPSPLWTLALVLPLSVATALWVEAPLERWRARRAASGTTTKPRPRAFAPAE